MQQGMTQERLLALLLDLPEHEPMGVKLLRQMSPPQGGELFPSGGIPREQFADATRQAVDEHDAIQRIVRQVRLLPSATTTLQMDDFT